MSKEIDNIDNLLEPFYKACENYNFCVHQCEYFDERHINGRIHIKAWTGQRASIYLNNKSRASLLAKNNKKRRVTFRDYPTWKFNFHIDNNRGCLQCNNVMNYKKYIRNEINKKITKRIMEVENGIAE